MTSRPAARRLRWLGRPWRQPVTLVATMVALATPVLMLASSQMFREGAADTTAEERVAADADLAGLTLTASGLLTEERLGPLDDEVRDQITRIDGLAEPALVRFTELVGLVIDPPPPAAEEPLVVQPGSGGVVLVDDRAVAALEATSETGRPGLWISDRRAERLELAAGDVVVIQGSIQPVEIAGTFRDLWLDGPRDPFWDTMPAALVPRFSRVFGGPVREIYVTDRATADPLELFGTARWDAELADPPSTLDDLRGLVADYRQLERAATADDAYVAALARFDVVAGAVPALTTEADDTLRDVERRVAEIEPPLVATTTAGMVLGGVASVAGALFVAGRRRREHRLLRSDGDGFLRFATSTFAEHLLPAAVATALGVGAAWLVARVAAPGGAQPEAVDRVSIAVTAVAALLVVSFAVAWAAVADERRRDRIGRAWLVPIVVLGAAAWIQVGRRGRSGEVDPLVVAFPAVAIVAGVGLGAAAIGFLIARTRRFGARLPSVVFLAWRRVGSAGAGATALAVAIGASVGLVAYATQLSQSLDEAVDAKVVTAVGGETQVLLSGPPDALPAESTIIRRQSTRLTVGSGSVEILAIDPATFADGVIVHPSSGTTAAEIIAMLERPTDAAVAAIAVGDASFPRDAGFGTSLVFAFDVVGRVDAAPGARSATTLIVDANRLEEIGLGVHRLMRPEGVDADEWDESYVSVIRTYRRIVVSHLPVAEVAAVVGLDEVSDRNTATIADSLSQLENRAATWSLDHLRLLAIASIVVALAGLVLYLTQERTTRALTSEMVVRMGLSRSSTTLVSVLEVAALATIAVASGLVTSRLVAGRVFARFEPSPNDLPAVGPISDPLALTAIGVGAVVGVAIVAVVAHLGARRRSLAEVLRGL